MSDLEKYIIEIRDNLDNDEPGAGHQKRFEKKLKNKEKSVRRVNFRHAIQIAASIAIILASGVVIVKSSKGSSKIAATPEYKSFMEAKEFYAQQVNAKYDDISALPFDSNQEKDLLLEELSEMDIYYRNLLDELDANPGDERVMNALIQHYQLKLQVMDQIIQQLIEVRNTKTNENENSTI